LPFRSERWWCANDDDRIGSDTHEVRRKLVVRPGLTKHEPILDRKVLTFDVAEVTKPAKECLLQVGVGGRGEIAYARCLGLLCVCFERRSSHSVANRFDEIATPHARPQVHRTRLAYRKGEASDMMSANGMVRPCTSPASDRSWFGVPKKEHAMSRNLAAESPWSASI